jgi:uncharacterized membrane protein
MGSSSGCISFSPGPRGPDVEWWGVARALHVVGVVLWIGGVAMVTLVLIPAVRRVRDDDAVALFERFEHGFARQSRWTTLLVGATGFYLVAALDLWPRFADVRYWWMSAMVLVWALFTIMLFVLEPFFLQRWSAERARRDPRGTLRLIALVHAILLVLSLATVAGAVAGSHGVLLFG